MSPPLVNQLFRARIIPDFCGRCKIVTTTLPIFGRINGRSRCSPAIHVWGCGGGWWNWFLWGWIFTTLARGTHFSHSLRELVGACAWVKVGSGGWLAGLNAITRSATWRSWVDFYVSGLYCRLLCQLVIVNWSLLLHYGLIVVRWPLCTLLLWARIIYSSLSSGGIPSNGQK